MQRIERIDEKVCKMRRRGCFCSTVYDTSGFCWVVIDALGKQGKLTLH